MHIYAKNVLFFFNDFINFRLMVLVIYNKILSFLCLQVINVFLNSHS